MKFDNVGTVWFAKYRGLISLSVSFLPFLSKKNAFLIRERFTIMTAQTFGGEVVSRLEVFG